MASFQVVSDLHLEAPAAYDIFTIPSKAPYLAMLGDIGNVRDQGFFPFIETQLRKFRTVYLLLGNHEPYHSSWPDVRTKIEEFAKDIGVRKEREASSDLGEFVFLDRTRYDVSESVTVLGCTLHSHVPPESEERVSFGLNDFFHIEDWTVQDHNAAHTTDVAWLNEQVASLSATEPERKIVIFTHHSPVVRDERAVDPAHAGSAISSGFSSDLSKEECWQNGKVCLWAFGHTHFNCNFVVNSASKEMKVVSNQRGYYFQQAEGFDAGMIATV